MEAARRLLGEPLGDGRIAERGLARFDVIHVSGHRDYADLVKRLGSATHSERYTLLEYEPNMGDCLAACDLVLARSGGSVFELTARGRPAVLVPYPHATGDHQTANAEWMAEAGAAEVITDDDLSADLITESVNRILGDGATLEKMAAASLTLARPDAAADIAEEVLKFAGKPK
jgi:UDP-N-acetylglucosamine--N-acetylmuramyl-(pentapeptide) pyrophosphoryl-undecaprenol N-acetylglucosamine transferase